eukprot:tig00000492_g1405.t1
MPAATAAPLAAPLSREELAEALVLPACLEVPPAGGTDASPRLLLFRTSVVAANAPLEPLMIGSEQASIPVVDPAGRVRAFCAANGGASRVAFYADALESIEEGAPAALPTYRMVLGHSRFPGAAVSLATGRPLPHLFRPAEALALDQGSARAVAEAVAAATGKGGGAPSPTTAPALARWAYPEGGVDAGWPLAGLAGPALAYRLEVRFGVASPLTELAVDGVLLGLQRDSSLDQSGAVRGLQVVSMGRGAFLPLTGPGAWEEVAGEGELLLPRLRWRGGAAETASALMYSTTFWAQKRAEGPGKPTLPANPARRRSDGGGEDPGGVVADGARALSACCCMPTFQVGEYDVRIIEDGIDRYVEAGKRAGGGGPTIMTASEYCPGKVLFARLSDDGSFFNCATYDAEVRVGYVVSFAAGGVFSSDAVKVPEPWPEMNIRYDFVAVTSPSGQSVAYTFYGAGGGGAGPREDGIWVVRKRPDGSWRRDQLKQQCGYRFSMPDDSTIAFDILCRICSEAAAEGPELLEGTVEPAECDGLSVAPPLPNAGFFFDLPMAVPDHVGFSLLTMDTTMAGALAQAYEARGRPFHLDSVLLSANPTSEGSDDTSIPTLAALAALSNRAILDEARRRPVWLWGRSFEEAYGGLREYLLPAGGSAGADHGNNDSSLSAVLDDDDADFGPEKLQRVVGHFDAVRELFAERRPEHSCLGAMARGIAWGDWYGDRTIAWQELFIAVLSVTMPLFSIDRALALMNDPIFTDSPTDQVMNFAYDFDGPPCSALDVEPDFIVGNLCSARPARPPSAVRPAARPGTRTFALKSCLYSCAIDESNVLTFM